MENSMAIPHKIKYRIIIWPRNPMTAGYISKRTESKDSNRYLNNAFNVPGYFPGGSDGKVSACNAGVPGLIPRLGRSPGEGNGSPLQYSCLENSMDRGIARLQSMESTRLSDFTFTFNVHSIIHNSKMWKQLKEPSLDEWISKMCYMQTMEYYSALNRKEILTHATPWMKLEDIIKWNKPRHKETNTAWFHLDGVHKIVKLYRDRKQTDGGC